MNHNEREVMQLFPSEKPETADTILTQEIPTEDRDQSEMKVYLVELQEQMELAASAADRYARAHTFTLYREGKRANTLRRQKADIACFMRYLDQAGVPMTITCERLGTHMLEDPQLWQHVTFGLMLGFRKWQLKIGYTVESVNAHLSTVKTYAGLASQAGYIPPNEFMYINLVKRVSQADAEQIDEQRERTRIGAKNAEPVLLDAEHLQRLFPTRPETEQQWRDLLALRLIYDMVLRPGEAITRTIGDIDLIEGTMHVHRKKTRLRQRLPLSKGTMVALTNYLPILERKYKEQFQEDYPRLALLIRTNRDEELDDDLKVSQKPGPIVAWTTQAFHTRVRELGRRIGIPNLYPYCARHQWAQSVVKEKNDIVTATKYGGWRSDFKMLSRYYGDEEIISSVRLSWE